MIMNRAEAMSCGGCHQNSNDNKFNAASLLLMIAFKFVFLALAVLSLALESD
jgi:hypothetical protein